MAWKITNFILVTLTLFSRSREGSDCWIMACLHAICWMNGWILAKLPQLYCWDRDKIWLSPRFLEKTSGILLSPPSVCLFVMLSPPKPLDRIQPNLVSNKVKVIVTLFSCFNDFDLYFEAYSGFCALLFLLFLIFPTFILCSYFYLLFFWKGPTILTFLSPKMFELTKNCNFFLTHLARS